MNDHRWRDVLRSVTSMKRHLGEAIQLFREGGLEGRDRPSYQRQMILMHTMEIGYTSFETAILRTMSLLGEVHPSGSDWHAQLLARAAEPIPGLRPPILSAPLAKAARRVKDFRHWATRGYDAEFEPREAAAAIDGACVLIEATDANFEAFIRAVDP